jgi:hypothetical protein
MMSADKNKKPENGLKNRGATILSFILLRPECQLPTSTVYSLTL